MMLQVQLYAAHTVAAAADMPLIVEVVLVQVEVAEELVAQEPSAQAHNQRRQMLAGMVEAEAAKAEEPVTPPQVTAMAEMPNTEAVEEEVAVEALILTTPMKKNRAEVRSLAQAAVEAAGQGRVVVLKI